jgi:hypothetical protein
MNRHPVGSSVGSSGEGVWALSFSLLANFTLSDEPAPSHLIPSVHPVLKEFCLLPRPAHNSSDALQILAVGPSAALFHHGAQLHRRFDRRFYFSTIGSCDATLECGSYLSYPSVASSNRSNPKLLELPPAPYAAALLASGDPSTYACALRLPPALRHPPVLAAGRHAAPPRKSRACAPPQPRTRV